MFGNAKVQIQCFSISFAVSPHFHDSCYEKNAKKSVNFYSIHIPEFHTTFVVDNFCSVVVIGTISTIARRCQFIKAH